MAGLMNLQLVDPQAREYDSRCPKQDHPRLSPKQANNPITVAGNNLRFSNRCDVPLAVAWVLVFDEMNCARDRVRGQMRYCARNSKERAYART